MGRRLVGAKARSDLLIGEKEKEIMADLPMKEGTTTPSGIETSMNATNVGRKNTPSTKSYPDMPSTSGGASIQGPGEKVAWPK